MKKFLKQLLKLNKRDYIGLACWFFVSVLVGSLSLLVMVARELYQYYRYQLQAFEWEDVVRYGMVILMGSVFHYEILLRILG